MHFQLGNHCIECPALLHDNNDNEIHHWFEKFLIVLTSIIMIHCGPWTFFSQKLKMVHGPKHIIVTTMRMFSSWFNLTRSYEPLQHNLSMWKITSFLCFRSTILVATYSSIALWSKKNKCPCRGSLWLTPAAFFLGKPMHQLHKPPFHQQHVKNTRHWCDNLS